MEKPHWFFIDSEPINRATENGDVGKNQIFVMLYFSYAIPRGSSGYGMISHFDTKLNGFIHKEMWVD